MARHSPTHAARLVLCAILLLPVGRTYALAGQATAPTCDAACLSRAMDSFVAAATSGKLSTIPLAETAEVRENTQPLALAATIWKDVRRVRSTMTFTDPITGNVVSRAGVELTDGRAAYISTRLKLVHDRITDVEISADRSDRVVADYVWNLDPRLAAVLPRDQQLPRPALEAIGRRYFHSLSSHVATGSDFDPACDRFHSGQRITNTNTNSVEAAGARTCASSLEGNPPWGPATEHRFPIVDTERGIIVGIVLLHYLTGPTPQQMYVSEVFKVVGGRIVAIDNIGLMMRGAVTTGFTH